MNKSPLAHVKLDGDQDNDKEIDEIFLTFISDNLDNKLQTFNHMKSHAITFLITLSHIADHGRDIQTAEHQRSLSCSQSTVRFGKSVSRIRKMSKISQRLSGLEKKRLSKVRTGSRFDHWVSFQHECMHVFNSY